LQRSVAQMQAARDVAELEYEIAQKGLEAVHTRIDAGTATLHDLDDARGQASERFIALQDVTFEKPTNPTVSAIPSPARSRTFSNGSRQSRRRKSR
ncbi:MAG: hypothetical protein LAP21_26375, partial [Acidobacteriia bacterium]|nr:hypothetical protein [Terriglobia bacterium]